MKKPLWLDKLLNFLTGDFFETYAVAYFLAVVPFMYLSLFYIPPQKPGGIFNATFLLVVLSGIFLLPALGITLRSRPFSFIHFLKLIGIIIVGSLLGLVISSIILLSPLFFSFTFVSPLLVGLGIIAFIKKVFALKVSKRWQLGIGGIIGLIVGLMIYLILSERFAEEHAIRPFMLGFGLSGWSYGAAILGSWAAIRESTNLSKFVSPSNLGTFVASKTPSNSKTNLDG